MNEIDIEIKDATEGSVIQYRGFLQFEDNFGRELEIPKKCVVISQQGASMVFEIESLKTVLELIEDLLSEEEKDG